MFYAQTARFPRLSPADPTTIPGDWGEAFTKYRALERFHGLRLVRPCSMRKRPASPASPLQTPHCGWGLFDVANHPDGADHFPPIASLLWPFPPHRTPATAGHGSARNSNGAAGSNSRRLASV